VQGSGRFPLRRNGKGMTVLAARTKKDDRHSPQGEHQEEGDGEVVYDQSPVRVVCPHCGLSVVSFIEHESSWVTYAVAIVLLMVLNWAALCVVPVVFPLFKDVVHHCPKCLSVLAKTPRVAITSFKQEVMSFRFGSCVLVLARKYVLMLVAVMAVVGGLHFLRTAGAPVAGAELLPRGELSTIGWQDFLKDCGYKSYLGNPIHVTMAFNEFYKNKTVHWKGSLHAIEEGLSLLWWNQRGAVYVRMDPPQFTGRRGLPDLLLTYTEGTTVAATVRKLKRGSGLDFEATFMEVGRRGAPHVLALWDLKSLPADYKKHTDEKAATGAKADAAAKAGDAAVPQANATGSHA